MFVEIRLVLSGMPWWCRGLPSSMALASQFLTYLLVFNAQLLEFVS